MIWFRQLPNLQMPGMMLQATHIFDGLESWPSHLMYLAGGKMQLFRPASEVPELQQGQLLQLVERWDNACHSSKAAAGWLHSLAVPLVQGCPEQPWPVGQQMKKIIIVLECSSYNSNLRCSNAEHPNANV